MSTRAPSPSRVSLHLDIFHTAEHVCSFNDPGGLLSIRIFRMAVVSNLGLKEPQKVDNSPLRTHSIKQLIWLDESLEYLAQEIIYVIVEFL